ncbi:hypothetical protein [Ruminococcus flavefaciens]|uniref:Uncharacterized protein n=1 Tax=Ruminococcus flavefaciens TaxID=1265 RepID=A0A1M7IFP0_RUMFL|nr:hypothetical protein [Ruminococcus flavefaciens]SHM39530.1 hypothetical protein SAMN04487860_10489 [Ruminococcus flavefaciens]
MKDGKTSKIAKSDQEQAVASWINYLNQIRLDRLFKAIQAQNTNLNQALHTLNKTLSTIKEDIIIRNRGGVKGMHGFIAEVAECGIGNARQEIVGNAPAYEWINDNGPADLIRDGIQIQQKFVNAENHLSLQAIKQHFSTYPWFIKKGCRYQIPQDHYDKIKYLLSISKEQANRMPTETGEFSLKQWREVHSFFENGDVKFSDIEPSILKYESVQSNTIEKTISDERKAIKKKDEAIRDEVYAQSKPTLQEGLKAGAISAVVEGGVTFGLEIRKIIKSGKSIKDFSNDDWAEICKKTGLGTVKGSVRGISIYALTNYTATPAAVANALVTASFGIAQQAYLMKEGKITQEDFLRNSEKLCVDVSVSALSSFIGQAVIPIPVVGAVIGNTIGNLIYQTAKESLKKQDKQLIESYILEIEALSHSLDVQYKLYVEQLNEAMKEYFLILEDAFAVDCVQAFDGSIQLARYIGVSENDILNTIEDIDDYFLS